MAYIPKRWMLRTQHTVKFLYRLTAIRPHKRAPPFALLRCTHHHHHHYHHSVQRRWKECIDTLHLTPSQVDKLEYFAKLLMEYNQNVNLTAIRDWDQVITKHCIDSLHLVPLIRQLASQLPIHLVDVGSGGGLPGIPLTIALTNCNTTLIDKTRKKVEIQQKMIEQLQLQQIRCVWTRVEVVGHDRKMRESFDFVTARAVASLDVLVEWTVPLLKQGGYFLAQKSVDSQNSELKRATNAIEAVGATLHDIYYTEEEPSPVDQRRKAIIILKKERTTPKLYPRPPGVAQKKRLG
jgi:16S rRNA (guanine527-N7)-methyltransferase